MVLSEAAKNRPDGYNRDVPNRFLGGKACGYWPRYCCSCSPTEESRCSSGDECFSASVTERRNELEHAGSDWGGHRLAAIKHVDAAIAEVQKAEQYVSQHHRMKWRQLVKQRRTVIQGRLHPIPNFSTPLTRLGPRGEASASDVARACVSSHPVLESL